MQYYSGVQFRVIFKLCLCAASRALLKDQVWCRSSITTTILSPTT